MLFDSKLCFGLLESLAGLMLVLVAITVLSDHRLRTNYVFTAIVITLSEPGSHVHVV